jgi:hypothetical protein
VTKFERFIRPKTHATTTRKKQETNEKTTTKKTKETEVQDRASGRNTRKEEEVSVFSHGSVFKF